MQHSSCLGAEQMASSGLVSSVDFVPGYTAARVSHKPIVTEGRVYNASYSADPIQHWTVGDQSLAAAAAIADWQATGGPQAEWTSHTTAEYVSFDSPEQDQHTAGWSGCGYDGYTTNESSHCASSSATVEETYASHSVNGAAPVARSTYHASGHTDVDGQTEEWAENWTSGSVSASLSPMVPNAMPSAGAGVSHVPYTPEPSVSQARAYPPLQNGHSPDAVFGVPQGRMPLVDQHSNTTTSIGANGERKTRTAFVARAAW